MQAAAGERRLLTFTIEADVGFHSPADVEAFTTALADAVATVAHRFHDPDGRRYRVVAGGHPAPAARGGAMSDGLRIEVTLPGSVEDVWPAFREPDLLRQWHGWEDESLDDEIRMIFADGTVVEDDGRTLHVGGHRFTFDEIGAQTIVRVTRATPPSGGDMDWDAYYDDIDEGWLQFLQQLRFGMTHHWGETRGTPSTSTGRRPSDDGTGRRSGSPWRAIRGRRTPPTSPASTSRGRCGSARRTSSA